MAQLKKTTQEEIDRVEKEKLSWLNMIRVTRSERDDDSNYQRSREGLEATIATLQKRLAELVYRHDHADEVIEDAKKHVNTCVKRVKRLKAERDIERLLELVALTQELAGEG